MKARPARCGRIVPLLLMLPLLAGGDTQAPSDDVAGLLAEYAASGDLRVPSLTAADLRTLRARKALVRVSGSDDGDVSVLGVWGLRIVDAPRVLVWLSVMGANDERDERLTAVTLSHGAAGAYVRYQHINLPWPFRDRHWAIHCEKNAALADALDGRVWEHRWQLLDDGPALIARAHAAGSIARLDRDTLRKSVYLPANRGAWALFDLGRRGTLVVGFLDVELGGSFPAGVVRAFTRAQLKAGLNRLAEMSTRVHRLYDGEPPVHDGHGRPLTRDDALRAVANWQDGWQIATID